MEGTDATPEEVAEFREIGYEIKQKIKMKMQKLNTLNNQNDDNNNDGSKDNNINNDNSSNKHDHNNRRNGKSKKVYNRPNSPEGFTSDIDYIKNRFKKNPSSYVFKI